MDVRSLSSSSLSLLSRCGQAWVYRYIMRVPRRQTTQMVTGRAVHRFVAQGLNRKAVGVGLPSREEVYDTAPIIVREEWESDEIQLSEEEVALGIQPTQERVIDETRVTSTGFTELHAPTIEPVVDRKGPRVERRFEIRVAGVPVIGYVDVEHQRAVEDANPPREVGSPVPAGEMRPTAVSGRAEAESEPDPGIVSIDVKTRGVMTTAETLPGGLQQDIYATAAWARDGTLPRNELIQLKRGTTEGRRIPIEQRTKAHVVALARRVEAAVKVIEAEAFLPAQPDEWWCSPRWCGYWNICPYGGGGRSRK